MNDSGRELIDALIQVSQEKGIDKEIIFEAIEASLVAACKKQLGANANVRVVMDRETGAYTVLVAKNVSETVTDDLTEMTLEAARAINSSLEIGDTAEISVTLANFGRISAQTAKQVVVQKIREAEREIQYNEYIDKQHQIMTGVVQRRDRRNVVVSLGTLEGYMPPSEQIPRESYQFQDRIKVYVLEVKQSSKGPIVNVSRTHPELLRRLFEQEVPEVYDGVVEVKSVAREAGNRSKVAVFTKHPHIDPVGSCVGQSGQRVNMISSELNGERIDVILYSDDPAKYIASALSPSKVVTVAACPIEMMARVVVPDHQLSLAIGKEGQNARLAARLTGWRIDIKSESQAAGTDFLNFPLITPEQAAAAKEIESAYADFYEKEETEEISTADITVNTDSNATTVDTEEPTAKNTPPASTEETITEAAGEAPAVETAEYDDEYYDDAYYEDSEYYDDDEYYDDEYYEDEYYDDEYYDENYQPETPAENVPPAE